MRPFMKGSAPGRARVSDTRMRRIGRAGRAVMRDLSAAGYDYGELSGKRNRGSANGQPLRPPVKVAGSGVE